MDQTQDLPDTEWMLYHEANDGGLWLPEAQSIYDLLVIVAVWLYDSELE